MELWQTFLLSVITAILGYIGGFLNYKQKIKSENISIKRERLIKNINIIEDYILVHYESNILEREISLLEEKVLPLKSDLELLKEEKSQIEDQINSNNKKPIKLLYPKTEDEYSTNPHKLSLRSSEIDKEISQKEKSLNSYQPRIVRCRKIVNDHKDRMLKSDIIPTASLIDPSGKLCMQLLELCNIYLNNEKNIKFTNRSIELRAKINKIFDEQISQVK